MPMFCMAAQLPPKSGKRMFCIFNGDCRRNVLDGKKNRFAAILMEDSYKSPMKAFHGFQTSPGQKHILLRSGA